MGEQLKLCIDCKNCFKSSRPSDDPRFRYGCLNNIKNIEKDTIDIVTGERINYIISVPDTCWYYRHNECGYENPKYFEAKQ